NLPLTTLRTVPRQLEHHHLDVSAHQPAHSSNPKALRHTLAVAALMPLSPCRSSPLITGARLAFALLYRHTLFLD
ncbi:MAG: hypothetical protein E7D81_24820, partial [Enterobacter asburiae]|nr:hypothetical protein [Enterobacter asburiae]